MKYLPLFTFLILSLISCHNHSDVQSIPEDSASNVKPTGYNAKQLAGVFYDTLPCADCAGMVVTMYLKPDNTFVTERNYLNKHISYETGTWSFHDSLLQLTGTDSPQLYKVENHIALEVLDAGGKEINSSPKKLELHRNNVPFKPVQPVPVEGLYSAVNDTINISICSMKKQYPVSLAPSAMIMASKYKQAAKQGQAIYAQVAGHFELRPSLKDTMTQDFFVIEKFIKFSPGQQCK